MSTATRLRATPFAAHWLSGPDRWLAQREGYERPPVSPRHQGEGLHLSSGTPIRARCPDGEVRFVVVEPPRQPSLGVVDGLRAEVLVGDAIVRGLIVGGGDHGWWLRPHYWDRHAHLVDPCADSGNDCCTRRRA